MSTPFPEPGEYGWGPKLVQAIKDRDAALQAQIAAGGGGGGSAVVPDPDNPGYFLIVTGD